MERSEEQYLEGIRAAEAYVDLLLDNAADAIITSGTDSVIKSFNSAACRIFGYEPEQVIGQRLEMLMPETEAHHHHRYVDHHLDGGKPKIIGIGRELLAKHNDGTIFPIYLSIAKMTFEGETRFVGIIRDMTELRTAEAEQTKLSEKLAAHNAELQQFVYIASHDLKEPLRKIIAFGDLLEKSLGESLEEKPRFYLDRITSAAERMETLIDALLNLSRVHTRSQELKETDLNTLLSEVIADLELRIRETGAAITFGALPILRADPSQMRQVFQNLILNAIKFQAPGNKPIVEIKSERKVDRLTYGWGVSHEITVTDNGVGFDMANADKIFEPFRRLFGKSEYPGSGIGLSIVRRIVQRHGGSISVTSKPNEGSAFVIILPEKQDVQLGMTDHEK